jgi:hypothetical protein
MMKAKEFYNRSNRIILPLVLVMIISLLIMSCDRGRDGRPGRAYLALNWELVPPEYIDAGTPDIPPYFHWGQYYRAYPGFYTLYYDGTVQNGPTQVFYAWEIDYEIWEEPGGEAGYYSDGYDGPDTYFTVVCNPNGPYYQHHLKNSDADAEMEIISDSGDEIVVLMEKNQFRMKLVYRKVDPRSRIEDSKQE